MVRMDRVLLVCVALCAAVTGGSSLSSASPFSAMNIDFLGRGGGQGLVADAGAIDNVVWNPSGLGFSTSSSAVAGYMDYLVTVGGGTAAYTQAGNKLGYGVHVSYLSSGIHAKTASDDQLGQRGETFKHGELVAGLSGGMRLGRHVSLGTGLKLATYDLDGVSGSGIFADLAGTVRIYPFDDTAEVRMALYASVVTRNLKLIRWQDEQSDVPRNSEAGLALKVPGKNLVAGCSWYLGREGRREMRFGFSAMLSDEFEGRLGYRRRVGRFSDSGNGMPWQRGIVAGFGIGFGRFWIDYTFEEASPLDNIHRFALRASLHPVD